jgi:hypothetical protein
MDNEKFYGAQVLPPGFSQAFPYTLWKESETAEPPCTGQFSIEATIDFGVPFHELLAYTLSMHLETVHIGDEVMAIEFQV